jgi:3-deoxy-D-manno-octulosonic acid (KDO) 8-phosphate synthase
VLLWLPYPALKKDLKLSKQRDYIGTAVQYLSSVDIKKIQFKISSLEMKESIGGDAEIQEKNNLLTNGFHFWFDLAIFSL